MSDQQNNIEQAQATLAQKVYLPAFLQKCAELGVKIESDQDVQSLLDIAQSVKIARLQHQAEAPQDSFLKVAADAAREAVSPSFISAALQDQDIRELENAA